MNTLRRIARNITKTAAVSAVLVAAALPVALSSTAGAATPTLISVANSFATPALFGSGWTGTLTITGTNFVGTTGSETLTTNAPGVSFATSIAGSTTVFTDVVTSSQTTPVGFYNLTVTDANGTVTQTNAFSVVQSPTLSATSPTTLQATATGSPHTVTLTGTGLATGDTWAAATALGANPIGGAGAITDISATSATISATTASTTTLGAQTITVTDPTTGGTASVGITVTGPTITAVAPSAGLGIPTSAGSSVQTVTLTGTDFVAGAVVSLTIATPAGVSIGAATVASSTSITVPFTITNPTYVAGPFQYTVVVTNSDGSVATSATGALGIGEAAAGVAPTAPSIGGAAPIDASANPVETFTVTGSTSFPITTGSTATVANVGDPALTLPATVTAVSAANVATVSVKVPRYAFTTLSPGVALGATSFTIPAAFAAASGLGAVTTFQIVDGANTEAVVSSAVNTGTGVVTLTGITTFAHAHAAGTEVEVLLPLGPYSVSINNGVGASQSIANIGSFTAAGADVSTILGASAPSLAPGTYTDTVTIPGFNFGVGTTMTLAGTGTVGGATGTVTSASGNTATVSVTIPATQPAAATSLNGATLAGAVVVTVASAAGFAAGGTITIAPTVTGALDGETRTIAAGYVAGGLTIPLTTALTYPHGTGIAVTGGIITQGTGTVTGSFTNGSGGYEPAFTLLTVIGPIVVSSIAPTTLAQGATAVSIVITGTGFVAGAGNDVVTSSEAGVTFGANTAATTTTVTVPITITNAAALTANLPVTVTLLNGTNTGTNTTAVFAITAAPTISAVTATVNPVTPNVASESTITVTGTGFATGDTVLFVNGSGLVLSGVTAHAAPAVTGTTSMTFAVDVAAGALSGSDSLIVIQPSGTGQSLPFANALTVTAPTITAISPSAVGNGFTGTLTITGTGFPVTSPVSTCSATLAGWTFGACTIVSATSATVVVTGSPSGATFAAPLTSNIVFTFTPNGLPAEQVTAPAVTTVFSPTVTSITPITVASSSTGVPITIKGSGFFPGATVSFGNPGLTAVVTSVTGNTITATLAATGGVAAASTVIVTNANGGFGTSTAQISVSAAPTITPGTGINGGNSVTVLSGKTITLTITGTGFATGVVVSSSVPGFATFGTATLTGTTSISVPVTVLSNVGSSSVSADITVTNPVGGGFVKDAGALIVSPNPTVTGAPYYVAPSTTNGQITVTGTGFEAGMTATSSNAAYTVSVVGFSSSTSAQLLVTTTAADVSGTSTTVTLTNPDGGTATFALDGGVAPPKVVTASPTGATITDGTSAGVTVSGTGFQAGATVTGPTGVTVSNAAVLSANAISLTVAVASSVTPGTYNLTVTNPDGGVATASFTVAAVVISTPTANPTGVSITAGTSQSVTIGGTGFQFGATVTGPTGVTLSNTAVISAGAIGTTVAVAATVTPGVYNLTVTNPDGGTATASFTVTAVIIPPSTDQPVVTSSVPLYVPTFSTGTVVTVTGAGFDTGLTATSSNSAFSVSVDSVTPTVATLVVSTTSAATAGTTTSITLTNPNGKSAAITVNGGPVPVPSATISRISGRVTTGKTVKVAVFGRNLAGLMKATSNARGTVVRVVSRGANVLVLNVTARKTSKAGVHTFTFSFSGGIVIHRAYSQH
ncbi:MAG TPA: IPT/TIG domain-containing protein [Acidimicrobiales bacterium]